jgi:23S rRNA A1618 N6-methylase RlmF
MAKSFMSTLGRSIAMGAGRQIGFRSIKQLEKEVAKKVIDPNSKFRKQIQRFTLPGKPKTAIEKMWTLIDGFTEEYENNNSMFQTTYKQSDIEFIEKKLDRIYTMSMNDDEKDAFEYLQKVWFNIKK